MTDKPNIQKICEMASLTAETLLRKNVDSVNSLTRDDDGWMAEVEVMERKSIPDTQDLLGRYEMKFDLEGELLGYKRVMIRRRSDLEAAEEEV
jgi:hypothetical protein